MKLLVNMNLSPRWVSYLAASQIEFRRWSSVGPATATDSEIMAYAPEHGDVVLTHDLDFRAILAATQGTKPSVVQIRSENLNPDIIGAQASSGLGECAVQHRRVAILHQSQRPCPCCRRAHCPGQAEAR